MRLPVVLIGNGCRGNPGLVEGLCSIGVPVLTTWQAIDLVPEAEAAFCGRPGVIGQRAANIIIQKSTELYVFGAKLDAETVGWNLDNFAPRAHKVAIDCDEAELGKLPASWEKIRKDLSGGVALPAPIEPVPEWMLWCMA
jgi:acetolactate synthase-1/2/3 large subunit